MDKVTRRAAAKAADLLLAAAGYNPKGVKLKAAQQKRRAYVEEETLTPPPAHAGGLLRETWRFFVARCRRFSMCLSSLNEAANWPG